MSKERPIAHRVRRRAAGERVRRPARRPGAADGHPDPDGDGRVRPGDRVRAAAGRARLQRLRRRPVREEVPRRRARHDVRRDEPAASPTARRCAGGCSTCSSSRAVSTRSKSDQIVVAGYCFGGMCALDLARSGADIAAAVSFHGLFDPPGLPPEKISAKVVAFHGWDDPMVPPDKVVALGQELTEAGADWQIHAYGHVGHGFTNPHASELADRRRRLQRARRRALVDQLHQPARGIVRRA